MREVGWRRMGAALAAGTLSSATLALYDADGAAELKISRPVAYAALRPVAPAAPAAPAVRTPVEIAPAEVEPPRAPLFCYPQSAAVGSTLCALVGEQTYVELHEVDRDAVGRASDRTRRLGAGVAAGADVRFVGLEPGAYRLRVRYPGRATFCEVPIGVEGRSVAPVIDLRFERAVTIAGRVFGPDGSPAAHAYVRCTATGAQQNADADGRFEFRAVRAREDERIEVTAYEFGDSRTRGQAAAAIVAGGSLALEVRLREPAGKRIGGCGWSRCGSSGWREEREQDAIVDSRGAGTASESRAGESDAPAPVRAVLDFVAGAKGLPAEPGATRLRAWGPLESEFTARCAPDVERLRFRGGFDRPGRWFVEVERDGYLRAGAWIDIAAPRTGEAPAPIPIYLQRVVVEGIVAAEN